MNTIYVNDKNNIRAVQNAINSLPDDGDTVVITKGEQLTAKIHLKSNVTLYMEENSILKFSTDFNDYLPPVFTRWEGVECYNYSPFIYAINKENIKICGSGTIEGRGQA